MRLSVGVAPIVCWRNHRRSLNRTEENLGACICTFRRDLTEQETRERLSPSLHHRFSPEQRCRDCRHAAHQERGSFAVDFANGRRDGITLSSGMRPKIFGVQFVDGRRDPRPAWCATTFWGPALALQGACTYGTRSTIQGGTPIVTLSSPDRPGDVAQSDWQRRRITVNRNWANLLR